MTLDVSVVIPCRDMWECLDPAVDSAFRCGLAYEQISIVGDGQYLKKWNTLAEECNFHWTNSHAGVVYARNLGIEMAINDLIVPLDADDYLLPNGLRHLLDAWKPGTLVYGGWVEDGQTISPPPPEMLSRKNVAHATWLFHRDDWRAVGGFDPDFNIGGEDWAFMVALVENGVKPVRIEAPIFRRTVQANSRTDLARRRIDVIKQLLHEKYPTVMHAGR